MENTNNRELSARIQKLELVLTLLVQALSTKREDGAIDSIPNLTLTQIENLLRH